MAMVEPRLPLSPGGLRVPPNWMIVPPGAPTPPGIPLVLAHGVGFGSGGHATTRLCLQALAFMAPKHEGWRLLDFGSGSGILSIAGAKLGAVVEAVEIDPEAIAHADENLRLNGVSGQVHTALSLEGLVGPFDVIIGNILRSVLMDYAETLTSLLAPGGTLLLSGLVGTDLPELSARYGTLLGGRRAEIFKSGDWRLLAWAGSARGV